MDADTERELRRLDNNTGCLLIVVVCLVIGGCAANNTLNQFRERIEALERSTPAATEKK